MLCPRCKTPLSHPGDNCPFCGHAFTVRGQRTVLYDPQSSKTVLTAAGRMERALFFLAFAAFSFTCGTVAFALTGAARQTASIPETPAASAPAQTPVPSPVPPFSPSPSPKAASPVDPGGPFFGRSGEYGVSFYISEGNSENPDTQASIDALLNETFTGSLTLDVDADGAGTVMIQQAFFAPDKIAVSAFVDSGEHVSLNTLYGVSRESGLKVTIVCVFENEKLSGFVWMDDDASHIEFLYSE